MFKFLKEMLSGNDGLISSKRTVMFIFTLLFVAVTIVNVSTGKNLDETLKSQLFYLVIWTLTMVFGEQITNIFNKDKTP